MNLFSGIDYKPYLNFRVQEARGNLTLFAKKAECQPSYLLRVIHEEAQLTPDQAHRLCAYWMFAPHERVFFMTQVELARAADADYRNFLCQRLDELLKAHNNLKEVVKRSEVSDVQALLEYHADYRTSLTHFLTDCPQYQSKKILAQRLKIDLNDLNEILNFLSQNGMIQIEGEKIKLKTGSGHIPKDSPILPIFLGSWRQLAVQKSSQSKKQNTNVHFTNVQTIGVNDVQKLIELSKQFIHKAKSLCDESASEDVIVINLDVFIP